MPHSFSGQRVDSMVFCFWTVDVTDACFADLFAASTCKFFGLACGVVSVVTLIMHRPFKWFNRAVEIARSTLCCARPQGS